MRTRRAPSSRDAAGSAVIDIDVRPKLSIESLESLDTASRRTGVLEDAVAAFVHFEAGEEVETRVGVGAGHDVTDGERVDRWSNVVELEGDGVLEIHSPSLVELDDAEALVAGAAALD